MKKDDWEIRHQAMLETRERCCDNCHMKYWEACTGINELFDSVDGCKKALQVYSERFHKLNDWNNRY